MNIGFLSDLHIDFADKNKTLSAVTHFVVEFLKKQPIDVLIISGDISSNWETTLNFLDTLNNKTNIKVYAVPGNHDFWLYDRNSVKAYEAFVQHPSMLINQFVRLTDDWCLYGGLGWYDYSFHTTESTPELAERLKAKMWVDHQYVDFFLSDPTFFQNRLNEWNVSFETNKCENIVFAQHFVPRSEFLTFKSNNPNWNFCNAYMGSEKIGKFINQHPSIKIASFGHTHKRFGEIHLDGTSYLCSPVGYPHEWESSDYLNELASSLIIKTI